MPKRAGDLLKELLDRTDIGSAGDEYVSFFRSWESIVGVDLAAHSRVSDIRNHAVVVEVDHPAWMQMVQMQQNAILKRIQKSYSELEITTLYLKIVDFSIERSKRTKETVSRISPSEKTTERKENSEDQTISADAKIKPTSCVVGMDDELKKALERLRKSVVGRMSSTE